MNSGQWMFPGFLPSGHIAESQFLVPLVEQVCGISFVWWIRSRRDHLAAGEKPPRASNVPDSDCLESGFQNKDNEEHNTLQTHERCAAFTGNKAFEILGSLLFCSFLYIWNSSFVVVQLLSCIWLFVTHGLQHTSLPCPSPSAGVCSNSCPLSRWCHPTISSSFIPFSCPQSFRASGSFPTSQFFTSGGQSIGASASASVLPVNIHSWFPLGWTGWNSFHPKGLSRVFSSITVQKHQLFSPQLSSQSNGNETVYKDSCPCLLK